ncbi:MAG TPA: M23 family metallopeptidase [Pyrinomonadaceae bacterium]|nr:M23 family metallopeptidase [Pyrinomonadaceae bacterium]
MAKLRILLCVVFLVVVSLVWLTITYRTKPVLPSIDLPPTSPVAVGTPLPPEPEPSPSPESANFIGQVNLIVPVAGVRPDQLIDTFDDARSEGRVHDAIDIPAPAETPVLAAANGKILKLFQSERGGTTIYQLNTNGDLVFYYAHLARYADGLAEGNVVNQGQVIAYVGDTGNAGPGNYHLHFSIATISDPKRYWEGTNINPYPLLHDRTH